VSLLPPFFLPLLTDCVLVCSVSRRYTFPLRSGHKTAYLCTETTTYKYVDNLDAPKKWFKSHVEQILDIYGGQHHIQREDLFLGTSLFLSIFVWLIEIHSSDWYS
jgi:hypothetical protein